MVLGEVTLQGAVVCGQRTELIEGSGKLLGGKGWGSPSLMTEGVKEERERLIYE